MPVAKGSSMARLIALRCLRIAPIFRLLDGPSSQAPEALRRAALRHWRQLSVCEQSTYNKADYCSERFDAVDKKGSLSQSIFMQHPLAHWVTTIPQINADGVLNSTVAAATAMLASETRAKLPHKACPEEGGKKK